MILPSRNRATSTEANPRSLSRVARKSKARSGSPETRGPGLNECGPSARPASPPSSSPATTASSPSRRRRRSAGAGAVDVSGLGSVANGVFRTPEAWRFSVGLPPGRAGKSLRARTTPRMTRESVNGPQPKRSQGLDDAKFINAPRPKTPTSTQVATRGTASGKGRMA